MPEINGLSAILADAVAYYRFESGADTTDSSGNSNNLFHVNTPTNVVGKFGNGMDYELSSSEYSYAADSASLDLTGDMSFAGWFKLEQLPSTAGTIFNILAKWGDGAGEQGYRFYLSTADKLVMEYSSSGFYASTGCQGASSSAVVVSGDVGNWVHLAMTVDVSSRTFVAYLNGQAVTTTNTSGTATSIDLNGNRMGVGAKNADGTANQFYDGVIDDLALFGRILTTAEVFEIYTTQAEDHNLFLSF